MLELARREAKRMMVGYRGGRASCKQKISTLRSVARQGKRVVRLKAEVTDGVRPCASAEEIAAWTSAGIPVAVIPGITAALVAASSLGVSLTHRDAAHSVRFVTGHSRQGELPVSTSTGVGLADAETSLMVYMGGRTWWRFRGRTDRRGAVGINAGRGGQCRWPRRDETCWTGLLSELGVH